ncbi:hypothetical protein PoB_004964900 [Plakobranchus ocellatus]|uniref:Uncharacterized protein n=1 Tax=Plakobranchus ocellatus TaxID=259542 RepID=A0AAV4BXL4_9GAST|nr:hypothetical protein PoB_004964900 [Plakobranchus ocellatus]
MFCAFAPPNHISLVDRLSIPRTSFPLLTMSDNSRDVHQFFREAFQKDTLEEFELIDQSFLFRVDDILSELGILEDD